MILDDGTWFLSIFGTEERCGCETVKIDRFGLKQQKIVWFSTKGHEPTSILE